jgi:hypothetical protein
MKVVIGDAAKAEIEDGVKWYEEQVNGLGRRFAFEIHEAVKRILAFPNANIKVTGPIRRALMKKFPYSIVYATIDDYLEIVAVAHSHRKPFYWKKRIKLKKYR